MNIIHSVKGYKIIFFQVALAFSGAILIQAGNCAPSAKAGPARFYNWYEWAQGRGTASPWNNFYISIYSYPEGLARSYEASSCVLSGDFCDYSFVSCTFYPDTPLELTSLDFRISEGSGQVKITGTIYPDDANCNSVNVFTPISINLEGKSSGNSDVMRGLRTITYTDPVTAQTTRTLYNSREVSFYETFTGTNGFVFDTFEGDAHRSESSLITPAQ